MENIKLASDILTKEHKLIEQLLDTMNHVVDDLKKGLLSESLILRQCYEFALDFVDLVHFQKEEQIWFKYFERNSPPDGGGPVAILATEHIWLRRYLSTVGDALYNEPTGAINVNNTIITNIKSYTNTLSNHIYKEETILYVMGNQLFSAENQEQIVSEFRMLDENTFEYYEKQLAKMQL